MEAEKKKKPARKVENIHKLFAKEYVVHYGNGTQAYMKVYPKTKEATAAVSASRLLNNVKIQRLIDAEYKKIFKEKDTEIEKSKTYKMIHAIGNSNISDVVDLENGTLKVKDISEIPPGAIEAIQSIKRHKKETAYGTDDMLEVRMHPKLQALELRAKLQGMIEKDSNLATLEIVVKPAIRPDKKKE